MNVVITGVSRGIGLELARVALQKKYSVTGFCRDPKASSELQHLLRDYAGTFNVEALDLTEANFETKLVSGLSSMDEIDILINNAGIYEKGESKEDFLKSFEVNSYAPFKTTVALLPKLKRSKNPKVVHITSLMGSIEDNTSGGSYAYRASKSALNMIHKCMTIDQPWLTSLVVHPGWVQTRMGGASAPLSVADSASGIWKVIEGITLKQSGAFKDYQGKDLPW